MYRTHVMLYHHIIPCIPHVYSCAKQIFFLRNVKTHQQAHETHEDKKEFTQITQKATQHTKGTNKKKMMMAL